MITEKVTSFIPDAIREAGNTIAAAIQGGSGGSSVEWSQIVTTGTKIATITIDDQSTDVYAPTGGGGGSSVSWNEIQTTGTKIAEITIDGTTYDVYAPDVSVSASDVSYDNTASGLTADDAQEAVDELAGVLSTLSGTVSGHTTDIGNLQTAVGSKANQSMIAPVETSTTASQAYAVGEQFILNGTLYTATAAITAGGTIVINGNCTASDTVTEQIKEKYSTSETIVGEWIDGTPVYQKVINFGELPNNTSKRVAHGIANMGYVISANSFMSKADYSAQYFVPVVNLTALSGQVSLYITNTYVYIATKSDQTSYTVCYVVMRYTKTA